ncbi:MAG TPA: hypothetical protein VIL85_05300, partial [Thermomicrobiales bacterium]
MLPDPALQSSPLRSLPQRRPGLLGVVRALGWLSGSMALLTLGGSATLAHIITRPRHLRPIRARQIDETIEEITFTTPDGLTL